MRLVLINPNTTASMTAKAGAAARAVAISESSAMTDDALATGLVR
jgi:Asp/Glu/hydantoin racemase